MARIKRGAFALVSALVLLATGAHPLLAHPPQQERLEEIQAEIQRKRQRIHQAEHRSETVEGEVATAEERRETLGVEIERLEGDLAVAQARLAELRRDLRSTEEQLQEWTGRLRRARRAMRAQQRLLDSRAATAYILGPGAYLEVILGAEDLRGLSDRAAYVEEVLTIDSDVLDGVEVARGLVAERQDHVEEVKSELAKREQEVAERTQAIANLHAERQELLDQVDLEISVQTDLLESLEDARARYEEAVAELEAESARIRSLIQSAGSSGSGGGGGGGQLFWPTSGGIVSGYGWRTHPVYGTPRFHSGVDIGGACGQPIWAAEDGQVLSAGSNGGYGLATVIDHGDGLSTLYAHQSSIGVSPGQSVSRGQHIGNVGTTGLSTGCHLHFEVRVNGEPVDPVPYLS